MSTTEVTSLADRRDVNGGAMIRVDHRPTFHVRMRSLMRCRCVSSFSKSEFLSEPTVTVNDCGPRICAERVVMAPLSSCPKRGGDREYSDPSAPPSEAATRTARPARPVMRRGAGLEAVALAISSRNIDTIEGTDRWRLTPAALGTTIRSRR